MNYKPAELRTQLTKTGRIRQSHSHSREALEALIVMAKASGVPINFILDSLILDGYARWLETKAIIKKLEGA